MAPHMPQPVALSERNSLSVTSVVVANTVELFNTLQTLPPTDVLVLGTEQIPTAMVLPILTATGWLIAAHGAMVTPFSVELLASAVCLPVGSAIIAAETERLSTCCAVNLSYCGGALSILCASIPPGIPEAQQQALGSWLSMKAKRLGDKAIVLGCLKHDSGCVADQLSAVGLRELVGTRNGANASSEGSPDRVYLPRGSMCRLEDVCFMPTRARAALLLTVARDKGVGGGGDDDDDDDGGALQDSLPPPLMDDFLRVPRSCKFTRLERAVRTRLNERRVARMKGNYEHVVTLNKEISDCRRKLEAVRAQELQNWYRKKM